MVQADALLNETLTLVFHSARFYADRRPTADAVKEAVTVEHRYHAKQRQQLAIKGSRHVEPADSQNDMRHAIDLDHHSRLEFV